MSDSWISWNPRIEDPSNPKPLGERVLGQLVGRHREVLGHARQVGEPHVDDLDRLVAQQADDFCGSALFHWSLLIDG